MNWEDQYKKKLLPSPREAVNLVKSGDRVVLAWARGLPVALGMALAERRGELVDVNVDASVNLTGNFPWYQPGYSKWFRPRSGHIRDMDRAAQHRKEVEFYPMSIGHYFQQIRERPDIFEPPDFFMVRVSPPDKHGYCCFGTSIWSSIFYTRYFRGTIIAQIDDGIPRVYGDSLIHVSDIDWFVEVRQSPPEVKLYKASEEEVRAIEVIGELTATLIKDRDCLVFGAGGISQRLIVYLENRQDMGYHSEVMQSGFPRMVEAGVFNGKYKTTNPGKAVATEFFGTQEEEAMIAENPAFEFYGVDYTDDSRLVASNDNVVAILNAINVDLSGQICSEAVGARQYTGTGGQLDFHLAALMSKGGRAITVLPATYRTKNGSLGSRIVPAFERGTPITVPRTLADWIITEHNMVNLMGKTLRERAEAIISLAHPDFRAELRKDFKKLPWY